MLNILIEANDIHKSYYSQNKEYPVLKGIDFALNKGDFICIMGTSGSGKSTLLNCLSTLDKTTKGCIIYKGNNIENMNNEEKSQLRSQQLGFVFQNHNLVSYLSVYDNIIISALLSKKESLKQKVISISKELEIEQLLDKFPNECSGGECQRISIARALINDPEVIFCDEPTGNLDSKNSKNIIEILYKLYKKGTTIVLVTHDPHIASYSQKLMYLEDGRIQMILHRNHKTNEEFYKDINEVISKDSLLERIKNHVEEENDEEVQVEEVEVVENKDSHLSRERIYISFVGEKIAKDIKEKYTICYIDNGKLSYHNKHNEEVKINCKDMKEINIRLKIPEVFTFSMFSMIIFYIDMDITVNDIVYQFEIRNRDNFIDILNYFKKYDIPIKDEMNLQDVYKQYPRDYERQKYYYRTYILNKKRG